jgi:hypothetical protein
MIYTSYFAKMRKMTPEQQAKCMSIARFTPKGVNIPINTMLAPHWDILKKYKEDKDEESYTVAYKKQLAALNPHNIAKAMDGRILLCYEKSGDFCHRHLLADWLRNNGYECEELEF